MAILLELLWRQLID
jgi:hypothetical protein